MRNRTSELQILHSDALPLNHIDSTLSEVYYKVPSSIPHGDSFFLCPTLLIRQKHLSLVQWKFNRGRLFARQHSFENSWNIEVAIQIFLYLPMSHFDSQSLYNIALCGDNRMCTGLLLLISDNMRVQIPINFLPWKKKKTVNVNTCVFDWLHFKKWCSEFNEFLLSQKSTGLFSSAKVSLTNLATDVYIR